MTDENDTAPCQWEIFPKDPSRLLSLFPPAASVPSHLLSPSLDTFSRSLSRLPLAPLSSHTQHKLANHEFTTKSLRELLLSAIDEEVKGRLLPVLASVAAEARPVDLQDLLRRFAFDTICNVSLGTNPGCLDPSRPIFELAQAFDTASEISARRAALPLFAVWKMKRALSMGSKRRLKEAIKLVHGEVMKMIRCKKQLNGNGMNSNDLLSRLISDGHDEEVIRDMMISFIMAGRDTTSSALTWLFGVLTQHPQIEKDVIHEISGVFGKL